MSEEDDLERRRDRRSMWRDASLSVFLIILSGAIIAGLGAWLIVGAGACAGLR